MPSGENQGCDGNDQAEVGKKTGERNLRPPCFFQLYECTKDGKVEYCAGPIYLLPKAKKRRADQPGSWKKGTGKPVKCKYCILYAKNGKDPQKKHLQDEELCLLRANGYLGKPSRTRNSTTEPPNKKQKTQRETNNEALEARGDVLPTSAPAVEQQVQPSNVVPASVSAPQQPLQPLNVEPTVEQPRQQASGFDALLQVMGESAQPSETQQPSEKPAMGESVDNAKNNDIPEDFVMVVPFKDNAEQDNASNASNDSWKSFGLFVDGAETHADTAGAHADTADAHADTADAQAIPGMSLDDASDS